MKFEGVLQVAAGLKIANFKATVRTSVSFWSPDVTGNWVLVIRSFFKVTVIRIYSK